MKIKQEHFDYMKSVIDDFLKRHPDIPSIYENGDFVRSDKVKNLQTRFCFDVMYMAGLTPWVCSTLYGYLHDDHIHTALKKICPKVEKKY